MIDQKIVENINVAIPHGFSFLLNAQVKEGLYSGAMPGSSRKSGNGKSVEKFNKRVTEIRIDYIQHTLSAD